jgi:hypothetical protein
MSAGRRAQERQSVSIWKKSAAWWVEREARTLWQGDAEGMPVEPPVEETEASRVYVYKHALIFERGQVEREALDLVSHNTGTSGGSVNPGIDRADL